MAVDASGNIVVGGYFTSTMDVGCGPMTAGGGDTPFLFKVDPAGNCLWSKGFTISQVGTTDQVKAVAVDASGNIYIVGTFFGAVDLGGGTMVSAGLDDVFLAKFTPAGAHVWSKRFGGISAHRGKGITVDAAGNVIIVGEFAGSIDFGAGALAGAGSLDAYVAKFDPAGNVLWSKGFGDASNQSANAVTTDAAGNVIIAGALYGSADFGGGALTSAGLGDVFAAKYTSAGQYLWSKRWGDAGDSLAWSAVANGAGEIVLTGYFAGTAINFGGADLVNLGGNDSFLVKLDGSGNHLWSRVAGGPGTQAGFGVTVDGAGNVGFAGMLGGAGVDFGCGVLPWGGQSDLVVAKYDAGGGCLWSHSYGGAAVEGARAIAVTPSAELVVTGLVSAATDFGLGAVAGFGGEDVPLVKFSP